MVISLLGGRLRGNGREDLREPTRLVEGDHRTVSASEMRSIVMPLPGVQVPKCARVGSMEPHGTKPVR